MKRPSFFFELESVICVLAQSLLDMLLRRLVGNQNTALQQKQFPLSRQDYFPPLKEKDVFLK